MSIRRKLLLAFTLVAAISSAALLALARSYVGSVRAQIDRQFLDDARAALDRQGMQGEFSQHRVFEVLGELARDPNVLTPLEPIPAQLFESAPALTEIVVWDARSQGIVRTGSRSGSDVVTLFGRDLGPLVNGPRLIWNGNRIAIDDAEKTYALAVIGSEAAPLGFLVAPIDSARLCTATSFGHEGQSLLVDARTGKLWLRPESLARLHESLPGLSRLLAQRPPHGETADVDDGYGRRFRLYAAVSAETPLLLYKDSVEAVTLAPVDKLYEPLARIRLRVILSVAATILLAFLAAFIMSGRFVGDIERIRRAVATFAAGDWRRLEKSSRDEIGGALVDSINDMAVAVAERMRRDEAESWRSLVRVVSHEINNTLAPIRSVAATLRSGLQRRLREGDAGADVDMALQLIVERVDALATFIDGYAEVAKLPPPKRRLVDVGGLVRGATALFDERAQQQEVTLDVQDTMGGMAEVDAQQLERVLVNIIKNALEAAPRGGHVTIAAARVAGGLEITVRDDGPGISHEAQRNLFVPYFSTKPGGSGIGLALARQIIVAHGGTITAECGAGSGTLMRLVIPDAVHAHPYREVG